MSIDCIVNVSVARLMLFHGARRARRATRRDDAVDVQRRHGADPVAGGEAQPKFELVSASQAMAPAGKDGAYCFSAAAATEEKAGSGVSR